ncbi:hypothetical protein EJ04DRAFT_58164 [Polyplosphaeria fusca]|uniref:Uncharacterized protein n=1 Tax=Polyplosphaeria fusca TaxID=682080 RepID=A0A9P4UVE8_9PLEO|nr:hypothetical protein EJ04DRAFT_58164 [Polyplosphaeria fusca]
MESMTNHVRRRTASASDSSKETTLPRQTRNNHNNQKKKSRVKRASPNGARVPNSSGFEKHSGAALLHTSAFPSSFPSSQPHSPIHASRPRAAPTPYYLAPWPSNFRKGQCPHASTMPWTAVRLFSNEAATSLTRARKSSPVRTPRPRQTSRRASGVLSATARLTVVWMSRCVVRD